MTITNQQGSRFSRYVRLYKENKKRTNNVTNPFLINVSRYEFQKRIEYMFSEGKIPLQTPFKVKPNGVDPSQADNIHCSQSIKKQTRVPIAFKKKGTKTKQPQHFECTRNDAEIKKKIRIHSPHTNSIE